MRNRLFWVGVIAASSMPQTPGVPKPLARDRVEAAKSVVMLDLAILNAEAAAGMYKKPIELIAKEVHYEPVPPEIRVAIMRRGSGDRRCPRRLLKRWCPKPLKQFSTCLHVVLR
jgi:hypothetical protein